MQRLIILGVCFVVLGGLSFWYLQKGPSEAGTLVGADREFAVPADQVYKIFLANRIDGATTLLERKSDRWTYNKIYTARPNAVENLLDAISRVEMMYKPPQAAVPNMLQDLATRGIKVELYDKSDKVLKVYYVDGSTADEDGTYLMLEDAEQPYVAHLPNWQGNLRFRYNLKGDNWRDRSIFNHDENEIASLQVEFPKQRQYSFRLERNSGTNFSVSPFYDLQQKQEAIPSKARIEAYLAGFKSVGAEAFRNNHNGQDSIRQLIPFCSMELKTVKDSTMTVRFFPIFRDNLVYDSKLNQYEVNNRPVERYFVDINGQDFMIAQHRVLKDLFWAYESFFLN